ncbi:MAG: nitroreductase family protein [Betaproteobacteria bacterium]
MDFMDVVKERRSVRAYEDRDVSTDTLERVLEAARLAPSASNRQMWKFIVVRDPERRRLLAEAANGQSFVAQAPVVIAGVALRADHVMSCEVPSYAVDLAIAMEHIALAAASEGLGTCWIGAFSQPKAREVLGVPDHYKIVALMPLGYPADSPRPKVRKPLKDIVCYERFSE